MNWRIKRLETQKAQILKDCEALLETAAKSDRDLTADEQKIVDDGHVEIEKINTKIELDRKQAEYLANAKPTPIDSLVDTGGNVHVKAAWQDDPKCGFKNPREFLMAVMAKGQGKRTAFDDQLTYLTPPREATAGSDEQGGYSDPYGGFLVPTGFSPDLLKLTPEDDPIGAATTKVPMSTTRIEIPARTDKTHTSSVSGGLTVCRRAETQTQSASQMTMEKVVLSAYSLFGLAYATEEILTDSPISFAALLEAGFRDQFTYHLVNERLNGTGVGEFEGVMNTPCLVSASADANQTATTITGTNIINMRARCWRYSDAIWLANHDTYPQLAQACLKTASSGYPITAVFRPSMAEDLPDTLLGRPIYFTEYCKTLGTVGDLVLGNWSQYLEGTYEPLQSAASVHVRFTNHERTFKFWMRNDGKCWWRSALTTKNSSNTLAPFVVLATRS
jgi:HK97 family phage major capsid protein